MKKLLALLMALVLTFALVACNTSTQEKPATDGGQTQTDNKETETPATEEKPVLKYLVLAGGENYSDVEAAINARLDELEAGYHIKLLTGGWDNYGEKVGLAARGATGEEDRFDLATTASWLGNFRALAEEQTLLDISEILPKAAPELNKVVSDMSKAGASINGKLYGIQTIIDGAPMARDMLIWNIGELEKIGKTIEDVKGITTTEGLEPIIKEWKEKFPEKFPMNGDTWAIRRLGNFVRTNSDGTYEVKNILKSDELKHQFEVVAKFVEAGYLHKESGVEGSTFKQEEPDTWLVSRGEGEPGSEADWTNQKKTPVFAVPMTEDNVLYNDMVQGKLTSVYAHTKYPEQAVNFIEKVKLDPTIQNLLAFGIEGTHYDLVDGKVQAKEQSLWNPWMNQWSNDVRLATTAGVDKNSEEMQAKIKAFVDPIVPSADLGFYPSPELQEKLTLVGEKAGTFMRDLQNGRIDVYDEWVKGLDEVNSDQVVEELKAEFEAWKAQQ